MPPIWDEHDDWYEHYHGGHLRPAHHRHNASYLHPQAAGMGARHRSRSQGHSPRPNVQIFNRIDAENMAPPHAPFPHAWYNPADAIAEQVRHEQMMLARRPSRSRSRSRSSSPAVQTVQMLQDRIRDLENRQWMENEDERLRLEIEKDKLIDQLGREHRNVYHRQDEDKWKNEWKYRQVKDEARRLREAKEGEEVKAAIIAEHEQQMKSAEEAKKAAVAEYMRKKADEEQKAKEAEEALRAKIKRDEMEKKEKAEKEMKELLLKQKEKEMKEKEKKKKKEEEVNEEIAKRLSKFGFQHNQIDVIANPKAAERLKNVRPTTTTVATTAIAPFRHHDHPTYVKVRCEDIATETLQYYNIPWQWDAVS